MIILEMVSYWILTGAMLAGLLWTIRYVERQK